MASEGHTHSDIKERIRRKRHQMWMALEAFLYGMTQQVQWFAMMILLLGTAVFSLTPLAYGLLIGGAILASMGFALYTLYDNHRLRQKLLDEKTLKDKRNRLRFWMLVALDAFMIIGAAFSLPSAIVTILAMPLAGPVLVSVVVATAVITLVFIVLRYLDRHHQHNKVELAKPGADRWQFISVKSIAISIVAAAALFWGSQWVLSAQGLIASITAFSPISLVVGVLALGAVWLWMATPQQGRTKHAIHAIIYGVFAGSTPLLIAMSLGLFSAGLSWPVLVPIVIIIAAVSIVIGVYAGLQQFKYNDIPQEDGQNTDARNGSIHSPSSPKTSIGFAAARPASRRVQPPESTAGHVIQSSTPN